MRLMFAAAAVLVFCASSASARQWDQAVQGWHFDSKDVKIELKDGVVNTENTVVFQLLQDASGKKPAVNAEPTAQLYIQCQSRQYRLWDVATSTQMGPISNAMFDVAQALEHYCDRIGKLPEEKQLQRGQR
jgi:opacity protein-like surface antigen